MTPSPNLTSPNQPRVQSKSRPFDSSAAAVFSSTTVARAVKMDVQPPASTMKTKEPRPSAAAVNIKDPWPPDSIAGRLSGPRHRPPDSSAGIVPTNATPILAMNATLMLPMNSAPMLATNAVPILPTQRALPR